MLHSLFPHPDTATAALTAITAEVARTEEGDFSLHYCAKGDLEAVHLPTPVRYGTRADNLWETTCFEAFAKPVGNTGYVEFNFAPSTAWAAYRLDAYRSDLVALNIPLCVIDVEYQADQIDIFLTLDACDTSALPLSLPWNMNLAAVIEEKSGHKSYWALAHPASGPPDFHDPACFVLELPPAAAT